MKFSHEIKKLRKPREKHFLMEDGSLIAKVYSEDIHYLKNGIYEEIDNTLKTHGEFIANKSNAFKASFPKSESGKLLEVERNGHILSMDLRKGNNICPNLNREEVIYEELLEGIDFTYQVLSNKIKEAIILKDKTKIQNELDFIIETDLELILNNRTIEARDKNNIIFIMEAPYMIDNEGKRNDNSYYELEKHNTHYDVILKLDTKWLEEAIFPVVIDPTITNKENENNVYDTFIYPGDTNINRNEKDYIKMGVERIDGKDIINRALLKFELPTIGTGSQIIGAEVSLIGYIGKMGEKPEFKNTIFDIHRITQDWNEEDANWNIMNDKYDTRIESFGQLRDSLNIPPSEFIAYDNIFDITDLVKKWYSGTPNYGFMMKAHMEEYNEKLPAVSCFSKNNYILGDNPKPLLLIHYRNQNGLENYMDYQTQDFTDISTSSNLYNGNLVASIDLGGTISGKFPAHLSMIYNTNDVILKNDYGYGLGYQLNFHQLLEKEVIENDTLLRYKDKDGTLHYFYQGKNLDGEKIEIEDKPDDPYFEEPKRNPEDYYDEDGLSLTISKENDNYRMKDNSGNTSLFIKNGDIWYLTEITDTNNNKVKIEYENNKIVKVIDGNNEEINITYGNNVITITTSKETIELTYVNSQISNIKTKNGTTVITYNNKNIIEKITDITGKSVGYEYYDTIPYRVRKMNEYSTNNTLGSYMEFIYGFHTTTIKDSKDGYYTYTFNNSGNTLGVTSLNQNEEIKDAFGKSFSYGEKNPYTTSFGSMNKLVGENASIKVVKNLLENSSFEEEKLLFTGDEYTSVKISEGISNTGNRSLEIVDETYGGIINNHEATYSISIPKGKYYTFSGYIISTRFVSFKLSYIDKENKEQTEVVSCNNLETFKREEVTIYYPEDAISDLKISIGIEANSYAYIDDIQLEEGEVANLYNLIDNSDFSKGMNGFEATNEGQFIYGITDSNVGTEIVTLTNGMNALKIYQSPYVNGAVSKKFNISGKAGDTYSVYFWYKNTGVDVTLGPPPKVLIGFDYGEVEDPSCVIPRGRFIANNSEWQFFEETFRADYDFSSFTLSILNGFNVNDLYLTNFALYKPINANTGYTYDTNGNMTTISDPLAGPKELAYDKNNQLISMMDIKGSNFVYEYDNKVTDRVIKGISSMGISNEIEYDEFGNPIVTRITNKNKKEEIEGNYYIRMKGTKDYFDSNFKDNFIYLKSNTCSLDMYTLTKEDEYYKIVSTYNPKYSLYTNENKVILNQNNYSLFRLVRNNNGSYKIILKVDPIIEDPENPIPDPKKYVTVEDNKLILDYEKESEYQEFYLEEANSKLFTENTSTYTEDGRFIKSVTDTLGRTITYDTDEITGLTNSVTDSKGISTNYTYNDKEQMIKVEKDNKVVEYEYNNQNLLSKILHGNKEYHFTYDEFLNTKDISIGNQKLITNNYAENNGNLVSSTYGNGDTISYEYDEFDRIKKINKMNDSYTNYYDNLGNIAKVKSNNHNYNYYYDVSKRLTDYYDDDFHINYEYDGKSNVEKKEFNNDDYISYEYNRDDIVTKVMFGNKEEIMPYASGIIEPTSYNGDITYTYDELGRVTKKRLNDTIDTEYHYISKGYRTSFIVDKVTDNGNSYEYKYDELDNITDIYYNGEIRNHYEYDNSNQLIKDDDYERNITSIYSYDNVGNILLKQEYKLNTEELLHEDIYEYSNSNWEDELTKFNDESITYDEIGNPLTIGNKRLNWINGRQLESIIENNNKISYEYNKDGIRTKKIVNGVTTNYTLENNHILFEQKGINVLYYIRDDNNKLIGFRYNGVTYYYKKNIQEDIIGILDSDYNVIVNYQYDAWGRILSITDNNGNEITNTNHIAYINPFRYRSYYYDNETKLYYLNSRYYNPNWGRFLNADGTIAANEDVISHNLFAYGSNNPINKLDSDGNFAISLGIAIGGLLLLGVASYYGAKAISEWVTYTVSDIVSNIKAQTITQTKLKEKIDLSGNHNVYVLRDENTKKIEYVGRTINREATKIRHKNNPNRKKLQIHFIAKDVSYETARGLEEFLIIDYYNTLNRNNPMNNQIHGVSLKNNNRDLYMKLAQTWISENEIRLE